MLLVIGCWVFICPSYLVPGHDLKTENPWFGDARYSDHPANFYYELCQKLCDEDSESLIIFKIISGHEDLSGIRMNPVLITITNICPVFRADTQSFMLPHASFG